MGRRFLLDSLRMAIVSLMLHKLRSILSIVGIVCGVSTVLAIFAIGAGAEAETMRRIEQMGISNIFIRADNLTEQQRARARSYQSRGLQRDDLVRLRTTGLPIKRAAASREHLVDLIGVPEQLTPRVVETTREYRAILGLAVRSGRFIADRDLADANRVCVLGWQVSTALGSGGKPGAVVQVGSELFRVVGVLDRQDLDTSESSRISLQDVNSMIIVPLGTMGRASGGEPVSELIVEMETAESVTNSLAVIRRTMQAAHNGVEDFNTIAPFELLTQAKNIQRLFSVVFGSIGALSLIIGGIGIMNIMLAGVSERVREIGVRRAVGARPDHIVVQFLCEAVLLTIIGGVLGTAGGWALAWGVSLYAGWPVLFTATTIIVPLLMALATGCLFGLYPAVKAARMDPLQALGYGG